MLEHDGGNASHHPFIAVLYSFVCAHDFYEFIELLILISSQTQTQFDH